jgi:hypothetical protein
MLAGFFKESIATLWMTIVKSSHMFVALVCLHVSYCCNQSHVYCDCLSKLLLQSCTVGIIAPLIITYCLTFVCFLNWQYATMYIDIWLFLWDKTYGMYVVPFYKSSPLAVQFYFVLFQTWYLSSLCRPAIFMTHRAVQNGHSSMEIGIQFM